MATTTISSAALATGSHVQLVKTAAQQLLVTANGQTYQLNSLQLQLPGKGQKLQTIGYEDLDKLDYAQKKLFLAAAEKAAKIFAKIQAAEGTTGLVDAHSFSLTFRQSFSSESGSKINVLREIRFTPSKGSEEQVLKLNLSTYTEDDQKEIREATSDLQAVINSVFINKNQSKRLGGTGKVQSQQEKTTALATAVKDAGSRGNKCAALSIAMISHPEAKDTEAARLIESSKAEIENNNDFITPGTIHYNALLSAALGYNETHPEATPLDVSDPVTMRFQYLLTLEEPGAQLDLPFLLTLDRPVIVLGKDKGEYRLLSSLTASVNKPIEHLSLADLKGCYIVLHTSSEDGEGALQGHYQPVIPSTEAHLKVIQSVLKQHEISLLQNITAQTSTSARAVAIRDAAAFNSSEESKTMILRVLGIHNPDLAKIQNTDNFVDGVMDALAVQLH